LVASTVGTLTIAGTTDSITMSVDTDRDTSGTVTAQGGHSIQMTDFHIKPPTFMLMLHTGNTIKVRFTLKATARAVQAARDALVPPTASVSGKARQPGAQP
jgi:polyisoprenoid-binding protein YceI